MKTFEERHTAWVDGKLSPAESASVEAELASHPEAALGKEEALALGSLLRLHGQAPKLANPEFFTHQILARIEAEDRLGRAPDVEKAKPAFHWPVVHLGWAGVCSLLVAFILFQMFVKPQSAVPRQTANVPLADLVSAPTPLPSSPETGYGAEIVSASSPDPNISVTPVHSTNDRVTVLWVDGLDYLPASYHPH